MNDYKELIERLRDLKKATLDGWAIERLQAAMRMDCLDAADAIEQLMHERFLIGEILVTASKWEIEPETALEQIRKVLRGE